MRRENETSARLAYSVSEAARAMGVCRNTLIKLVREGRIRVVRAGDRSLIPAASLQAFLGGDAERTDGGK